jgi:hypothetical protein
MTRIHRSGRSFSALGLGSNQSAYIEYSRVLGIG